MIGQQPRPAAGNREPLEAGDPLRVGRYWLTARLGSGGMGLVYLGVADDGRLVAVKVLRPELADHQESRARFGREMAVLTRVRGARIVGVIEAGTEGGRPFLVTEYAAGPTLAQHVESAGPLDAGMLYGVAAGLAEALAAIHRAGIVHRDLKPGNVILATDGPKVIDFGIAQMLDSAALTQTGMTIGTTGYMAPEQVTGQAGPAADVFAWAVTLAYAASGQPPFGAGPTDAVVYRILHAQPNIAAVPEGLRPVVAAALAKDPGDRPAAHEILDRLATTLTGPRPAGLGPNALGPTGQGPTGQGPAYADAGTALLAAGPDLIWPPTESWVSGPRQTASNAEAAGTAAAGHGEARWRVHRRCPVRRDHHRMGLRRRRDLGPGCRPAA
jgi:serine/threonine protein kinase